jgi:predicted homoserine dehydrogenase-like protein
MNPRMFNSFLDGTKSAIEMAAIANACDLAVPADGLNFPPCGVDDLPQLLHGREAGGVLDRDGMVEVVSCLERDGRPVFRDLRWGVYVVLKAPTEYARGCFKEYGLRTDTSGWYAAMYKPYHLIGLELGISVVSAALRGEATGQPHGFRGDAVAWPNGRSGRARCSTARAASPSGASWYRRNEASPRARCRSVWRTGSRCAAM